ncbi:hypothetical protein ACX1C1_11550 [Paenibacillus sp. strain BS8-2]
MSSETIVTYTPRLSDNDTMTTKLIYRIREQQLSPSELNELGARCRNELRELRHELNMLLDELRATLRDDAAAPMQSSNYAA